MSWVSIADACVLVTDGTHYTPKDVGEGFPFVTVKDLSAKGVDFAGSSRITQGDFETARAGNSAPQSGDVLFSKDGTVGKVYVVEGHDPFAVLSSIAILRPKASVDSRYLGHILRTPEVLAQAVRRKTGSGVPRIILSDLKRVQVPLPPLEEQRRIAAILDGADALRAKRQQMLVQLELLKRAVFQYMFGDVSVKRLPLAEVAQVWDCAHTTPQWRESGLICLRTSNLIRGGWDWGDTRYVDSDQFLRRSKGGQALPGDIILSREGTVGIGAIVAQGMRVAMGQRLVQVRFDPQVIDAHFGLEYLLRELAPQRISNSMVGSTSQHLNVRDLRALPIPLVEIEDQQRYARAESSISKQRIVLERALAADSALFASLRSRAFRGEL